LFKKLISKLRDYDPTKLLLVSAVVAGSLLGLFLAYGFDSVGKETIFTNPGGSIWEYLERYEKEAEKGASYRLHGDCFSACTFVLLKTDLDKICDDGGTFWFHGVYRPLGFDTAMTTWVFQKYPKVVQDELKKRGFDGTTDVDRTVYPIGLIPLTGKDLNLGSC
jgi:hypothetical protein